MAGLDDGFMNPLEEFRETSMNLTNGSNVNHPSILADKSEHNLHLSVSSSNSDESANE